MKRIVSLWFPKLASDRLARTLGVLESNGFGYQLSGFLPRPYARATYQDVVIAAYRKC